MILENFKFIPQSNKQKGIPALEDLLEIKTKVEVNWSIKVIGKQITFKKQNFVFSEGFGYTAALSPTDDLYIFKTKVDNENPILEPKFLKGGNPTPSFTSGYLSLLFETKFPNETLFQTEIVEDDIWKVKVAQTDTVPTVTVPTITADSIVETPVEINLSDLIPSKMDNLIVQSLDQFI